MRHPLVDRVQHLAAQFVCAWIQKTGSLDALDRQLDPEAIAAWAARCAIKIVEEADR